MQTLGLKPHHIGPKDPFPNLEKRFPIRVADEPRVLGVGCEAGRYVIYSGDDQHDLA